MARHAGRMARVMDISMDYLNAHNNFNLPDDLRLGDQWLGCVIRAIEALNEGDEERMIPAPLYGRLQAWQFANAFDLSPYLDGELL